MKSISKHTRAEAWLDAVDYLSSTEGNESVNLVLEITDPTAGTERSRFIETEADRLLSEANLQSLHTIAETIFPYAEYLRRGAEGVYVGYPEEIYPEIRTVAGNSRGTYAYRILRGVNSKGKEINPLEQIVERMKSELDNGSAKKPIYDISVDDAYSIPIHRNDTDISKYIGFPCLSHLSFKLSSKEEKIYLTAIYRSHYYIERALGNLLGLGRLMAFVCREVGMQPGCLVCHSTFAKLDYHRGVGKTRISDFLQFMREEE